ncbi:alginate O-acetyltransferase AlgX-related protein [Desulfolutivibrio sulfoxidireducens]|uniref:alginate O-acetyltransferase AlgX-related protein n=1 Tax=Desulfolutivibrio sulfoxidireducens TaxID=2773299 RepID=UPI00159E4A70|nr:hypothetical protein [Desulfolutivibrio sulfoxidireducens]QLA19433.1 hypothetical protein GD604_06590 [Desulfolutivibrio sulfoxidireducens]
MNARLLHLIQSALFVAILGAPMAAAYWGLEPPDILATENRTLAEIPGLSLFFTDPVHGVSRLKAAFADRFPLRQTLIRAGNRLRLAVFGESPVSGVIVGRQGWLYYSLENALNDHLNVMNLPPILQDDMVRTLVERRDRLAARGIAFYVLVPPDKHTVYPEFLPPYVRVLRPRSRLDILKERLADAGIAILDVRDELARAKTVRRAYWKTDTHWNDWGAFTAAKKLIDTLRARFPDIPPLCENDFDVVETVVPGGDLAGMLLLPDLLPETDIRLIPRDPNAFGQRAVFGAPRPYADPANHPERAMVVAETGERGLPKALFFRDSFSSAMIPFLAGRFQSAVFLWTHAYHPDIVAAERPDVVVLEVVERYQYAFCLENPPEPSWSGAASPTPPGF